MNQAAAVQINDLDTFVRAIVHWHTNKASLVNHMKAIPEGTEVSVGDDAPITMEGDFLKGFQLGLSYALSQFGELPFSFEFEEDGPPMPTNDSHAAHLN